ncbi:MAG: class I SAM-dependent methyltransferase [Flavobacteriales bacterium]
MKIVSSTIEAYISRCSEPEPKHLKLLSEETRLRTSAPHMSVGHYQGRVLSLISKLVQPRHVLEIGTFTGYSALCLAEGITHDGFLITIDINENLQSISQKYFDNSDYAHQIRPMYGNALKLISELPYHFNLVFIDADKRSYVQYFDLVVEKMLAGGVILTDNVLWSSKVLEAYDTDDKEASYIRAYNEKLRKDPRVETIMLPIRDGLTLARVK